ncbi:MAG: hypothetical protein WDA16_02990 [Candidatus Thermoplasmatota archaeon]
MDVKKAYGILSAVGSKLGERARTDSEVVTKLRATADAAEFRSIVKSLASSLVPDALVTSFVEQVVTDADWDKWKARLLVQVKMVRDGAKRAPGHEAGKGVARP